MFRLNHRSIKVTLFSEIHIKIISKISLTYHQIASLELRIKFEQGASIQNAFTGINFIIITCTSYVNAKKQD